MLFPPAGFSRSIRLAPALKAEEYNTACAGLGLLQFVYELDLMPLFIGGDLRTYCKWLRRI